MTTIHRPQKLYTPHKMPLRDNYSMVEFCTAPFGSIISPYRYHKLFLVSFCYILVGFHARYLTYYAALMWTHRKDDCLLDFSPQNDEKKWIFPYQIQSLCWCLDLFKGFLEPLEYLIKLLKPSSSVMASLNRNCRKIIFVQSR